MKRLKKLAAIVLSGIMVVSMGMSVMADETTGSATTGNILALNDNTVVLPTSMKLALNPNEYPVTTKTGITSTAQIVSLNYGIASKATRAKDVQVSFALAYTAGETGKAVSFVDSLAKAQPKSNENPNGATSDELKMYLAVVASAAAPKADAETAFAVTGESGSKTDNATAAALSDVSMTAASSGAVTFEAKEGGASAKIAFKLGKATYAPKSGQTIDWETTQDTLGSKMEMTALGDIAGFTLTGGLNNNADWTTANIKALTVTPTYKITDAGEDETLEGGYKQIKVEARPSIATTTYTVDGTEDVAITVNWGLGDMAADGIASITFKNSSGADREVASSEYSVSGTTLTISKSQISNWVNANVESRTFKITFNDTAGTAVDVTMSVASGG